MPLPEPGVPLVTVSHDWLLVAVHAQPVAEVTVKLDDPPAAAGDAEVGVSEYEHVRPACVTV